jgi:Protein of unknown function, DUF547
MRQNVATAAGLIGVIVSLLGGGGPAASRFDHSLFDQLLRSHVASDLVDYAAFARAPELAQYLARLEEARPQTLSEPESLAFWINVYNAYTIQIVNAYGPVRSIRDVVAPGRDGKPGSAWQAPVVRVDGRTYTLDQVEHDLIRGHFREPRAHFALVCAAIGCPPLRNEAYVGDRLEVQLDDQARSFLYGRAKGCRVDAANGIVYLSEIFAWYKQDFGADDAAVGRYVARYLPETPERRVLLSGRFRLVPLPFDWSLNDSRQAH